MRAPQSWAAPLLCQSARVMSLPSDPLSLAQRCRILIADDHPIVRASVRCLLETAPTITVVAEAEDGEDALAKIEQFAPDVALVDVAMPKLNGIEVVRRVARSSQRTRVVALTAFDDGRHVRETLEAGAAGFVPKSAAAADLIAAIHAVAAGGHYVHPRVAVELLGGASRTARRAAPELSEREAEVLRLIALGYTNKEVAVALEVSVKTVETYKARATQKIGAVTRVDIMKFAVEHGWIANRSDAPS